MNEADSIFSCTPDFIAHLRSLREERLRTKAAGNSRKHLTPKQRAFILEKTGRRCHICGGAITDKWVADHVYAHTYGGEHSLDNFLPAHRICNGSKWFYGTEEFQWIMKMGVYFRTQLEEVGNPDAIALAQAFLEHERHRDSRRKNRPPKPTPLHTNHPPHLTC
ncbi:MAG: HNH endonuclease [Comamonas sp.]